ncbi:MAG: hypothetical protein FJY77_02770 [Candidatus Altiarchaeales archaeon]|nr:hypothetical protein [Candidatus Altiarchaeales archaeon]
MKRVLFFLLFILTAFIIFRYIESSSVQMEPKYRKVLVIGIDGMDPKQGERTEMPNFRKLEFHTLDTSLPPHSPVAWTTIATGVNPGRHNIFDFIRWDSREKLPKLSLWEDDYSSIVKAEPLWRITSKAGIPTTVIRYPVTFPPEKVKGSMLSGLGVPDVKGFLSGYSFYTDDISVMGKKVIHVQGNPIETYVSGPRKQEGDNVVDVRVPMKIALNDGKAVVSIDGKTYDVKEGGWSDWIRVKFKTGFLSEVYGICKVYLMSSEPFKMYLTTVQIDPENPMFDISYTKEYSAELAREMGLFYTLGMPEDTDALNDNMIDDKIFLEQCDEIEAERDKMFWKEFEKFNKQEKGLLVVVYDTSDRLQHIYGENVSDYFLKKDRFLGEVLSRIDNNTAVIVLSDHGFTTFDKAVSVNTWLAENGYIALTREISAEDEGALFEYVDWDHTKAFSVGFNSVYCDEKITNELVEKLGKVEGIFKVYRKEDVYSGIYIEEAPNIILGFKPGYRMSWQNAVGGFTPEVVFENTKKWRNDHLVDPSYVPGVLYTNFKTNKEKPHQVDVAPTILSLLGLKPPEEMDGDDLT